MAEELAPTPIGTSNVATFDFIVGDEFRNGLESDYREMTAAIANGSWKSAHVLAGSIVEAILIDYIAGSDIPKTAGVDPLKLDLGEAIKLCRKNGILSDRVASLSDVVRSYRNLIHPGRVIRLKEVVDEQSARVAAALVDMVSKEVGKTRAEARGLTAEQLVRKLESDPSSLPILGHLIADLDVSERERILVRVIPDAYIAADNQGLGDAHLSTRFARAFRDVFDSAPDAIKKKAALRFVDVLREEVQWIVEIWEAVFFHAEMLKFVSEHDSAMIKAHLLARIKDERSVSLFKAATGISPFLKPAELTMLVDGIVRELAYGTEEEPDAAASALLEDVYRNETPEADKRLFKRLKDWVPFLTDKGRTEAADRIDKIRAGWEDLDDLPF